MILAIGSINTDISIKLKKTPAPGENEKAISVSVTPGGKGANQAVAASKAGAEVYIVGCVGDDDNGKKMLAALKSEKVNTDNVYCLKNVSTSTAYIMVDGNGENAIVVDSSANMQLTSENLYENENLFKSADYCILQHEISLETVKTSLELCKKHNVPVFLNPSPLSENTVDYIDGVQYLIPNENEAAVLFKKNRYEDITNAEWQCFLNEHNIENVIVTLGSEGCTLYSKKDTQPIHYPAKKMTAVDTTGAGDTFLGTFAASISMGNDVEKSIKFAQTAAGIVVTRRGTQCAMPSWDEISSVISQTK